MPVPDDSSEKESESDLGEKFLLRIESVYNAVMGHWLAPCNVLGACPRLAIVTRVCWFESDVSIV